MKDALSGRGAGQEGSKFNLRLMEQTRDDSSKLGQTSHKRILYGIRTKAATRRNSKAWGKQP
jgi:hypothetical protein